MVKWLTEKEFIDSFQNVPRVAVNLLLKSSKGGVLLTKRAIPPLKGYWHYPGTFLLKGEKISKALERLGEKELGIKVDAKKVKLVGVFENLKDDPRGHVVDLVYEKRWDKTMKRFPRSETKEAAFFDRLPAKIGFNHQENLNSLGYF